MLLRLATHACGTRFELVLDGEDEVRLRAIGELCLEEIEDVHARLSKFDRASLVSRLNRDAHRAWVRVDRETFELLELCRDVQVASGGAFDPTVGALMTELGFHDDADVAEAELGFEHVQLDAARCAVRFARPLRLDLGGIGKGHALDLAGRVLREHGVTRALLHGGTSSVLALGAPPGSTGWRIRIAETGETCELRDRALGVSSGDGRTLADGRGHVLDPRSGEALAPRGPTAVVADSAALADAWSTALQVLPAEFAPPSSVHPLPSIPARAS